jgi:serine/threonine-protein kinase
VAQRPPNKPLLPLPFLVEEAAEEQAQDRSERARSQETLAASLGPGYRLVTRLAVGGMAEVWMADVLAGTRAGQTVALKRLLPALRADAPTVARFRAEAALGGQLDHPNLAHSHVLEERGGDIWLVQELVGGETVGQLAVAARRHGERISTAASLHATQGLLAALAYLHAGGGPGRFAPTVHGDVNPDNLVAGPEGAVKLIDFGLAASIGPDGLAQGDGALRGTPAYMAPEQVKGRPLSPRADLFSAGILLWELLANRPLFAAQTEFETLRRVREMPAPPLRAVWPQAPTVLERLCVRALAKDAEQRFVSAAEMREALLHAAQREGIAPTPEALAAEVRRHAPGSVGR